MEAEMLNGKNRQVCTQLAAPPVTVLEKILFLISMPWSVFEDIVRQLMEFVPVAALVP